MTEHARLLNAGGTLSTGGVLFLPIDLFPEEAGDAQPEQVDDSHQSEDSGNPEVGFQCRQEEDAHRGAEFGDVAGEAAGRGSHLRREQLGQHREGRRIRSQVHQQIERDETYENERRVLSRSSLLQGGEQQDQHADGHGTGFLRKLADIVHGCPCRRRLLLEFRPLGRKDAGNRFGSFGIPAAAHVPARAFR